MRKKYHISKPSELKEIRKFIKIGNVDPLITVWSSTLRKNGKTPWDNSIVVVFDTKDGKHAYIARELQSNREPLVRATLKYTPSLTWCEKNLQRMDA